MSPAPGAKRGPNESPRAPCSPPNRPPRPSLPAGAVSQKKGPLGTQARRCQPRVTHGVSPAHGSAPTPPSSPRFPGFSALARFASNSGPSHLLLPRPGRLCLQASVRLVPRHPLPPGAAALVGPVLGTPCERAPPPPAPATRLVTVRFSPSQCFPPAVSELDLRSRFSPSLGFCGETCAPGSRFYFQHRVLFPAHIRRFDKQQLHTRLGSWDLELEATPEAVPASPLEPWGPARFSGGRRRAAGRRAGPPGASHPSLPAWGRSSVWASWASGR